jgi:hypothetical protein
MNSLFLFVWSQVMKCMVEDQPHGDANGEAHENRGQYEGQLMEHKAFHQHIFEYRTAHEPVTFAPHC